MGSPITCWLVDVDVDVDGSCSHSYIDLCSSGQDTTVKGEGTREIVHPVTPSVHGNQCFLLGGGG